MQLTEAEWKVMRSVWEAPPVTARDVLDAVADETGWAYTTVKTMMSRLVEKGVLRERKRGGTSHYEPRLSEPEARHAAVVSLLDRAFDGAAGPLVHFLLHDEKLSRRDRAELRRLLDEQARKDGKR